MTKIEFFNTPERTQNCILCNSIIGIGYVVDDSGETIDISKSICSTCVDKIARFRLEESILVDEA